ncbi:unnamed protein product [Choristocarpus tenellus]
MALNYGLAFGIFFGTEAMVCRVRGGKQDASGYATAGLVTGVGITLPVGGRAKSAVAGLIMAGVGFGGFYASQAVRRYMNQIAEERQKARALPHQARERE